MTELLKSPSFPEGIRCNRTELEYRNSKSNITIVDVIRIGVAAQGRLGQGTAFSDDDLAAEYTAQKLVRKAVEDFKAAIEAANELSAMTQIRASTFDDFVHDNICDEGTWGERIADARRG